MNSFRKECLKDFTTAGCFFQIDKNLEPVTIKTLGILLTFQRIFIFILILTGITCSKSTEPNPSISVKEGDILEFYECTVKPEILVRVEPVYPDSARAAGIEGMVVIAGLIGIDGLVEKYEVKKSIPALDQAAIGALLQFKFKPAEYHGVLVKVWVTVPFKFEL